MEVPVLTPAGHMLETRPCARGSPHLREPFNFEGVTHPVREDEPGPSLP